MKINKNAFVQKYKTVEWRKYHDHGIAVSVDNDKVLRGVAARSGDTVLDSWKTVDFVMQNSWKIDIFWAFLTKLWPM